MHNSTSVSEIPYLTAEIPGINGKIKYQPQDFRVNEIPLYPCSGEGEHIYLYIEKTGVTTFHVLSHLSKQLNIPMKNIGYAGMKDARAVTRQYFSIPLSDENQMERLQIPGASILSINRHVNKLRLGHLQGNRFEILIRDWEVGNERHLYQILDILKKKGVPNYYGNQRFGIQHSSPKIGRAILTKDADSIGRVLFERNDVDSSMVKSAKEFFAQGNYEVAYSMIPNSLATEKRILKRLLMGDSMREAIEHIPPPMRHLYICAYQSDLFNRTLAMRLQTIDEVWPGDLAVKHPSHSVFYVEEAEKEQPRCTAQEISPTGPLFGYKVILAKGKQGDIEEKILKEENLNLDLFKPYHLKGERRSYRFFVSELDWKKSEDGLWITFSLPKGCYATVVLREIMKESLADELVEEDADDSEDK